MADLTALEDIVHRLREPSISGAAAKAFCLEAADVIERLRRVGCTCGPSNLHMECPTHGAAARSDVIPSNSKSLQGETSDPGLRQAGAPGESPALLPCPFCRQSALKFWDSREAHEECEGPHTDGSNDVTWAVVCDATNLGCGASAGFQPTKQAAADSWNARSSVETIAPRTDHAANVVAAAAAYVNAAVRLNAEPSADGVWDVAGDTWRALKTALHEHHKHSAVKSVAPLGCDYCLGAKVIDGGPCPVCSNTAPAVSSIPQDGPGASLGPAAGAVSSGRIPKEPQQC